MIGPFIAASIDGVSVAFSLISELDAERRRGDFAGVRGLALYETDEGTLSTDDTLSLTDDTDGDCCLTSVSSGFGGDDAPVASDSKANFPTTGGLFGVIGNLDTPSAGVLLWALSSEDASEGVFGCFVESGWDTGKTADDMEDGFGVDGSIRA